MLKLAKKSKRTDVEQQVDDLLQEQLIKASTQEELEQAMRLMGSWNEIQKNKGPKIPWDTIAIVGGNLLGICLILGYEKANVITSKALNFVTKGRV